MRTGSRRHRISTVFQVLGRRADSLRIGRYTNFLDTTDRILVNYERMRLAMERIGLLLEVRLHSKDCDFGEYIFQKVEHDLDILEDQIGVLDTLIDLSQIQEF